MEQAKSKFASLHTRLTSKKGASVLLVAICLVLFLVPIHGFLSTWLGSALDSPLLAKSWKEVVLLAVLPLAIWLVVRDRTLRSTLSHRLVNRLAVAYVLLHLLYLFSMHGESEAYVAALTFNLRFLLIFIYSQIAAYYAPRKVRTFITQGIFIMAGLSALVAIVHWLFLPDNFFSHFGYGVDSIPAAFHIDNNQQWLRYFGLSRGPVPLGLMLAAILPLLLASFWQRRKPKTGLLIVIVLSGLYLTFARSAWLAVAIATAATMIIYMVKSKGARLVLLAVISLGLITTVLVNGSTFGQRVLLHRDPTEASAFDSDDERFTAWEDSLVALGEKPLLGYGPGFAGPAAAYRHTGGVVSENYYLQIGLEVGIIGLILFLSLIVVVARDLWVFHSHGSGLAGAMLASLIGLSIAAIFAHLWAQDEVAYIWWGTAGLLYSRLYV